jgi:hypothetical protein
MRILRPSDVLYFWVLVTEFVADELERKGL